MKLCLLQAALALPLFFGLGAPVWAQDETAAPEIAHWQPPRTQWGDPDLRGNWPIDYLAQTPRQRPAHYGDRAELTDEEYAAALENARNQQALYDLENEAGKLGMGHWIERGLPLRQTSLITQPASGRIPPMTPEGARLAAQMKSSWTQEVWQWVDDFNSFDRCITRGMPSSMLPGNYNGGIEIFQSPGHVAIRLEMIHETRIVTLDGRAPPPPSVQGWMGYSRGSWEGNTLVIETTNFMPGIPIGTVGDSPRPVPSSTSLRIVEKLTPTGPDTIHYEAWVHDPQMLTAPFKLDFPWQRNEDYEIYEYACHEGNVQLRGFIEATSPLLQGQRDAAWEALSQAETKTKTNTQAPAQAQTGKTP